MEGRTSGRGAFSEDAFRRFYEETLRQALTIAKRVCGDDEDAREACQDAYLAVYRYWSAGRLTEPPHHLLFRAVRRSAIDALRSRLHRERRPTGGSSLPPVPGTVGGPLERALRQLRPEDAALLVMQAVVGMTYEELSRIEGVSVGAIRSRLFRARRGLARHYEAEGGEW